MTATEELIHEVYVNAVQPGARRDALVFSKAIGWGHEHHFFGIKAQADRFIAEHPGVLLTYQHRYWHPRIIDLNALAGRPIY
jgi:hypothetical protein